MCIRIPSSATHAIDNRGTIAHTESSLDFLGPARPSSMNPVFGNKLVEGDEYSARISLYGRAQRARGLVSQE